MLERLINVTKTTFFIKNDNFLLKIKNSSQYVLQFLKIIKIAIKPNFSIMCYNEFRRKGKLFPLPKPTYNFLNS